MLQFKNRTPFVGTLLLLPDPDGIESLFVLVKATFTLGGQVRVAEKQLPIVARDQYYGEPGRTSLKASSDIGLLKPGTDVLLVGSAHAPGGTPARQTDVSLAVGPIRKTIRVLGDRVWESRLLGAVPGPPAPFVSMPLVWERAFGGTDQTEGDVPQRHAEPRNPVGTGFRVKNGQNQLEGMKLPNLEDPRQLLATPRDRPAPAGCGPIGPDWEPRRSYAGTYDEPWQKQRAPYLPRDFDPRFFQTAPPDQVTPTYLQGGEAVELLGVHPSGPLHFALPTYRVQARFRLDNEVQRRPANLDTVVLEPDAGRLVLVWRTAFACDKKTLRVREIEAEVAGEA